MSRDIRFLMTLVALLAVTSAAHAQFAVIDVASLTQLVSEVQTLEQQVATARNQLTQAQSEYQSITGARGMQQLLAGTTRNYLPADWAAVQSTLQGSGGYPALAAQARAVINSTGVLSPQQLDALAPTANAQVQAGRESVALLASFSHTALANASNRFASLQKLIDAIGAANDQKGILELQARIGAELGMLQNENTKLQVLYQAMQAQDWANAQRTRELTIAGHGQFDSRFQPHP